MLVTTGPQDTQQPLSTPLADASAQLQSVGVDVYSFGVGPNVVPSELETVASRPEYVFRAQTSSLPILSSQLTDMIRQGKLYQHHPFASMLLVHNICLYKGALLN